MDDKTRNIGLIIIIILIIAIVGYIVFQPSTEPTVNMSNGTVSDNTNTAQKNNSTANAQGKVCPICNGSGKDSCALCNGTGKDGNSVCPSCNGAGKFPCEECGGDGYIDPKDKGYSG
jgi:DnaJ-class molecular chaperone